MHVEPIPPIVKFSVKLQCESPAYVATEIYIYLLKEPFKLQLWKPQIQT